MQGTQMRRRAPCWHRRADVGLRAVNDAAFVQSVMYSTLKRHFFNKPYYKNVLEMFNEVLTINKYLLNQIKFLT